MKRKGHCDMLERCEWGSARSHHATILEMNVESYHRKAAL
jgi:hypothetical protein